MKSKTETLRLGQHTLQISNRQKILYPEIGFTKGDVLDYYREAAPYILPYLRHRPTTLKRYPDGVDQPFFYQKHAPAHAPEWLETVAIPSDRSKADIEYPVINTQAALLWAANLASLEFHPLLFRQQDVERPTHLVFDLDPGAPADVLTCAEIALELRDTLLRFDLRSFCKTSGSKGLQLYVPLHTKVNFDETKIFAQAFAKILEGRLPKRVTSSMKKSDRCGRVFIDWSQNDRHKTTVAAYSLRARVRPWVSLPMTWEEIEIGLKKKKPNAFFWEASGALRRMKEKGDLFKETLTLKQKLPAPTAKKEAVSLPSVGAQDALKKYRAKRDFTKSAEPEGKVTSATSEKNHLFVVQKHDASRLHYDFRLEMDGTLKSWAVPKGVPLRKAEPHLAVAVEDHPIAYGGFEGIIPKGEYGGGTVMLWDRGTYKLAEKSSRAAYAKGHLHVVLKGRKLHGTWLLTRMKNRGDDQRDNWLMIKQGENLTLPKTTAERSILSRQTMDQIARHPHRVHSSHAR